MTENAEPGSLKAYITADMAARRADTVQKIAVPRFNGRLVLRCHTMADRDLLRLSLQAEEGEDKIEGLIQAAISALLSSCDGTETDQGVDLEKKLGLELSQYLGEQADCGQARDDREAVLEVFGGEADVVIAANKLGQLQTLANEKIEVEVVGNSAAAG